MTAQLNYGNWIRRRKLVILGVSTLSAGLLIFLPIGLYRIIPAFLFIIFLLSFLLPLNAYVMFSQAGGKFQERIYHLILQNLGTNGKSKILDIGSGNGVLAIKAAQQNAEAEVTGVDYWGSDWEYSKGVCKQNARIAGVSDRVHFQKGDAAALEFANDTFDGAISNLTFHEVRSVADKREVVQEALRVIKPGGRFAFVDYFFDPKFYGKASEFEEHLKVLKLSQFEYKMLRDVMTIPMLLKHPKILGKVGIIYGRK